MKSAELQTLLLTKTAMDETLKESPTLQSFVEKHVEKSTKELVWGMQNLKAELAYQRTIAAQYVAIDLQIKVLQWTEENQSWINAQ